MIDKVKTWWAEAREVWRDSKLEREAKLARLAPEKEALDSKSRVHELIGKSRTRGAVSVILNYAFYAFIGVMIGVGTSEWVGTAIWGPRIDDTDLVSHDLGTKGPNRVLHSNMTLYVDWGTGCEYIKIGETVLPRMILLKDAKTHHVCLDPMDAGNLALLRSHIAQRREINP